MKRILACFLTFALVLSFGALSVAAVQGNETKINSAEPSDDHIKMHDGTTETVVAFRTVITGTWYGVAPYVGDYGTAGEEFTVSVYAWDTSYTKTLEGTALRSGTVSDAGGNGYKDLLFDTPLPEGDYLTVYHGATPADWGIATWFCAGATTGVQVWKNGVKEDSKAVATKLYVDASAGAGFSRTPLTDAPVPSLTNPYAPLSGAVSYGYGGGQWNPNAPITLTGSTVAMRVVTETVMSGIAVYTSCASTGEGGYLFSVYRWTDDYGTTVGTDPIRQWVASGLKNDEYVNFPFENGLEAGDYLVVLSDAFHSVSGGTVSLWKAPGDSAKACVTYVNGEERTEFDLFALIYAEGSSGGAISPAAKLVPAVDVTAVPAGSATTTFADWNSQEFVNIVQKTVGIRAAVTSNWYGMSLYSSGSEGGTGGYIVSVYAWNADYAASVAGAPLEQKRVEFSTAGVMQVKFSSYLPAGEYLVTMDGGYDSDWGRGIVLSTPSQGLETETYVDGALSARHAMAWLYVTSPAGEGIAALPGGVQYEAFQTTDVYGAEGENPGRYNIRFVASGSDMTACQVGFRVSAVNFEGKAWDLSSSTVYSSILAASSDGHALERVEASSYDAAYLSALTIKGVPANTEVVFEVTPYIVTAYGTIVYGTGYCVTIAADGTAVQTEIGG